MYINKYEKDYVAIASQSKYLWNGSNDQRQHSCQAIGLCLYVKSASHLLPLCKRVFIIHKICMPLVRFSMTNILTSTGEKSMSI